MLFQFLYFCFHAIFTLIFSAAYRLIDAATKNAVFSLSTIFCRANVETAMELKLFNEVHDVRSPCAIR